MHIAVGRSVSNDTHGAGAHILPAPVCNGRDFICMKLFLCRWWMRTLFTQSIGSHEIHPILVDPSVMHVRELTYGCSIEHHNVKIQRRSYYAGSYHNSPSQSKRSNNLAIHQLMSAMRPFSKGSCAKLVVNWSASWSTLTMGFTEISKLIILVWNQWKCTPMCLVRGESLGICANLRQASLSSYTKDKEWCPPHLPLPWRLWSEWYTSECILPP
jgi:hypothetical protein